MTYPPQGPYGQQPDPYGQQQPQYGGGYPQQQPQQPTGQYGGYDPNAQYGGGYQQYGGFGGPPPQPPKSKTGPIIAIVSVVVLLLAGLGITGFVAPGFFLSDDKDGGNNAGSGDTSAEQSADGGDSGAQDFIDQLVAAADSKDSAELKGMACADATRTVDSAIEAIDNIDSAELRNIKDESDDEVTFVVAISYEGKIEDDTVTIKKDGGDWCWQDIDAGTATGGDDSPPTANDDPVDDPSDAPTGDTEGEQFVQSFLDKVNGGDGAGAAAMSCSDSTSQSSITEAAAQGAKLEMDPAGTTADDAYVGADLKGTLAGAAATGRTSAFLEDGKWCIYTFFAS